MPSPFADGPSPNNLPVKVSNHRKPFKELTQVEVVQDIKAHDGKKRNIASPPMKTCACTRATQKGIPSLTLRCYAGAIWAMQFSCRGLLLATGGQDGVVRVWEVLDRCRSASGSPGDASEPSCGGPVLSPEPIREMRGHEGDILSLSWSGVFGDSEFLLSASIDRTVRLWHASSDECLRVFEHPDMVTCVDFYPRDERFFLSAAADGSVSLWSIPEATQLDSAHVSGGVSAACFMPSGAEAAVGTMSGQCHLFRVHPTEGPPPRLRMELSSHLDVKNTSRGSRNHKVTGELPPRRCSPARFHPSPSGQDRHGPGSSRVTRRAYPAMAECRA